MLPPDQNMIHYMSQDVYQNSDVFIAATNPDGERQTHQNATFCQLTDADCAPSVNQLFSSQSAGTHTLLLSLQRSLAR